VGLGIDKWEWSGLLTNGFDSYLGKNSEIDAVVLNKYFLDWTNVLMTRKVKQVWYSL